MTLDGYEDYEAVAETLREVLSEDYADATPDELHEALLNMFDALAPAEAFNLGKAVLQAGKTASRAFEDPAVAQMTATALPLALGGVGSLAGPAGTAVGAGLGQAAGKALVARAKPRPGARPPGAKPPPAGGSPAATTGLVMTQQPRALKSIWSVALGEYGRKTIDGIPVSEFLRLLSAIFAQAAEDAEELARRSGGPPAPPAGAEGDLLLDARDPPRALYAALVADESEELAEAVDFDE